MKILRYSLLTVLIVSLFPISMLRINFGDLPDAQVEKKLGESHKIAFAPGEVVLKLKSDQPAETNAVIKIMDSLGVKTREVKPVFTAIHAMHRHGLTEEEILNKTISKLKNISPKRYLPTNLRARGLANVYRVTLFEQSADVINLCAQLQKHPSVEYAEPNFLIKSLLVPDDPYYHSSGTWGQSYDDLWGIKKIQCEGAWDVTTGSQDVIVAVVDTGIDYNHEDLVQNIWINTGEIPDNGIDDDGNGFIDDIRGYDFCTYGGKPRDNDPMDGRGHGTHCAGTIAAVTDNTMGVAAISWHSKLMAVQGLDETGTGWDTDLAEAVIYAADNGASVINCSWGAEGWDASQVMKDAMGHAYDLNCVIVAAAGNFNAKALMFFPANMKEVITISAFDDNDIRASFSNWGIKIDVAAPGVDILSCLAAGSYYEQHYQSSIVGEKYIRLNGTSMAAPHVSGLSALILSNYPEFSNEQVRQVLRISADDVSGAGWDEDSGYGRINATQAMQIDSPLVSKIDNPIHREFLKGIVNIFGTAEGTDFRKYRVEYGWGLTPSSWTLINESNKDVVDGLLATWDTGSINDGEYTLRLITESRSGYFFEDRVLVWKDSIIMDNWPVDLTGPGYSSVALKDVDGLDGMEVTVGTPAGSGETAYGKYFVCTHTGDEAAGDWPQDTIDPVANSPAVGDLDLDGSMEIVGTTMGYRMLYAWDSNGSLLAGFPKDISRSTYIFKWGGFVHDNSPVLADIDGDPELEILIDSVGKVWAVNRDGTNVPGWPVIIMTLGNLKRISDPPSVAVGDLDHDGLPEIIAYASYEDSDYPYTRHTYLHVLNHDGTPMETGNWPVYSETISTLASPTLGDMDFDGDLEVLVGGRPINNQSSVGYIHAWHHDGTPVVNWPVPVSHFSLTDPVLANLDGDPQLEVIMVTSGHRIYVYNHDGTKMLERGITFGGTPHPAVGDVDGDGSVEILVGGYYGDLHALNTNGANADGWPKKTTDLITTSPAIGDLDGDLDLEVVVSSKDARIYAWDIPFLLNPILMEWPTYRNNTHHTGRYFHPPLFCTNPPEEIDRLTIQPGPPILFSWLPQGLGIVYDVAGGLVSDLVQDGGTMGASCLANDLLDPLWADIKSDPSPGEAYYYLIRGSNYCGNGTYGYGSDDSERLPDFDCP
jgi:subtilisin family serine protease